MPKLRPAPRSSLVWSVLAFSGLLTLFSILAGLYLFLGVTWARWPISLLCIFEVVTYYCVSAEKIAHSTLEHFALALALVSLALLFWPGYRPFS